MVEKLPRQAAEQGTAQLASAVAAQCQQLWSQIVDGRFQAVTALTLKQAMAKPCARTGKLTLNVFDQLIEQLLLQRQAFVIGTMYFSHLVHMQRT